MKMNEILSEEGYDTKRDKDAVSGKPRKKSITVPQTGAKSKDRSKDKKAALDAVKSQFSEMSASSVAVVAMPVGPTLSRQMKNKDGTVKNALDMDTNIMGQKKKSKSKKA